MVCSLLLNSPAITHSFFRPSRSIVLANLPYSFFQSFIHLFICLFDTTTTLVLLLQTKMPDVQLAATNSTTQSPTNLAAGFDGISQSTSALSSASEPVPGPGSANPNATCVNQQTIGLQSSERDMDAQPRTEGMVTGQSLRTRCGTSRQHTTAESLELGSMSSVHGIHPSGSAAPEPFDVDLENGNAPGSGLGTTAKSPATRHSLRLRKLWPVLVYFCIVNTCIGLLVAAYCEARPHSHTIVVEYKFAILTAISSGLILDQTLEFISAKDHDLKRELRCLNLFCIAFVFSLTVAGWALGAVGKHRDDDEQLRQADTFFTAVEIFFLIVVAGRFLCAKVHEH